VDAASGLQVDGGSAASHLTACSNTINGVDGRRQRPAALSQSAQQQQQQQQRGQQSRAQANLSTWKIPDVPFARRREPTLLLVLLTSHWLLLS
jgi:hypothetical protein